MHPSKNDAFVWSIFSDVQLYCSFATSHRKVLKYDHIMLNISITQYHTYRKGAGSLS